MSESELHGKIAEQQKLIDALLVMNMQRFELGAPLDYARLDAAWIVLQPYLARRLEALTLLQKPDPIDLPMPANFSITDGPILD